MCMMIRTRQTCLILLRIAFENLIPDRLTLTFTQVFLGEGGGGGGGSYFQGIYWCFCYVSALDTLSNDVK